MTDLVEHVATSSLPEIPGGWSKREIIIAEYPVRFTLPTKPDLFLDDPVVREASRRDDYMPYWPYLWPAALTMAERVVKGDWPGDSNVLELGAGTGLVGLAALMRGNRVTFTDYQQEAVDLALHNARQNGFEQVWGELLDWRSPRESSYPVILGCELLYETRNHLPLLNLFDRMLEPEGLIWLGDPGRQAAMEFLDLANQRNYRIELRNERGDIVTAPCIGRFQLIQLVSR